jgi:hypothetical protein
VHRSLRWLVTDLQTRAQVAYDSLAQVVDPRLTPEVAEARSRLTYVRDEAAALLTEDLEDAGLSAAHFSEFRDLSEDLVYREDFQVPFLLRFADADAEITGLCRKFAEQAGWPWTAPLVGAFSSSYYGTFPQLDVVAAPANEERRLLGLPILAHELGHIAQFHARAELFGDFPAVLQAELRAQAAPMVAAGLEPAHTFHSWLGGWGAELMCDLFATYLVGPAFGWQMLRAACVLGAEDLHAVQPGATHPADDARLRATSMMLRRLGHDSEADEIELEWDGLVGVLGRAPRADYLLAYPDALLSALAERVEVGCGTLGLTSYAPAPGTCHVASVINEAWQQMRHEPASYPAWEVNALATCAGAWAM